MIEVSTYVDIEALLYDPNKNSLKFFSVSLIFGHSSC